MNKEEFLIYTKNLNINVSSEILKKLDRYFNLIIEYNSKFNLTRIVEEKDVYLKHFYDSLCLIKVIDLNKKISLCDIGTGAGIPGIVLKIFFPYLNITLIESNFKKCSFLNIVIKELKLKDIVVINDRSELYAKENREKFDVVTARAVSSLKILSEIAIPMVKINGFFLPLKSNIEEEIKESNNILKELNVQIEEIKEYFLPIENSRRTILKIKKNKKTNTKYPREYNKIKK